METGSGRQLRDVAGTVELVGILARDYVELWADRLGILEAWQKMDEQEYPRR